MCLLVMLKKQPQSQRHKEAAHKSSTQKQHIKAEDIERRAVLSIHYTLTQLAEAKGFEKMVL